MESIFIENLSEKNSDFNNLTIPINEAKHLKALRIKENEKILVTNGKGLSAIATVTHINKIDYKLNILEFVKNNGELDFKLGLAIGILANKDRFEFAIEKCTELGISDIFPLILDYSQLKNINKSRLFAKTVAAIKQSNRSMLPNIHNPMKLEEILAKIDAEKTYKNLIIADSNGIKPQFFSENSICENSNSNFKNSSNNFIVFIGTEGGFSDRELLLFPKNVMKWNLGNRRLRTETAAITAIGILQAIFH